MHKLQFEADCGSFCVSLGRTSVRVRSKDIQLLNDLASFFFPAKPSDIGELLDLETLDLPDDLSQRRGKAMELILNTATKGHLGLLYVDAAALSSAAGKVMIAAESMSGTSTLATYAALSSQWKVLTDDLVFIDPLTNIIIPFCSPLSLRAGGKQLLKDSCVPTPEPLLNNRYYFDAALFTKEETPGPFDVVIVLHPSAQFRYERLTTAAALMEILKLSNALVGGSKAIDALHNAIGDADCYRIFGGSVRDRMGLLEQSIKDRFCSDQTNHRRVVE